MNNILKIVAVVVLVGIGGLLIVGIARMPTGAFVAKEPTVLRFVAIPAEEQSTQLEYMQPLADHIAEEVGMPVELHVATDYNAAIEALKYKHAEIAWLGPFSYILADEIVEIEPIVGGIKKGKELTYQSIIFTRADSGIENLEDIKGRTFAFNDPASTSGYLVPMYAFYNLGIDPEKDFEEVTFAGSHAAAQLAVYNGKVDAGASNSPTYEKMVNNGDIDPNIQKIIWYSNPIPPSPIVVRKDLGEGMIAKIQSAFLTMKESKGVGNKDFEGYAVVEDSDYDVLRVIAETLGLDLSKQE